VPLKRMVFWMLLSSMFFRSSAAAVFRSALPRGACMCMSMAGYFALTTLDLGVLKIDRGL